MMDEMKPVILGLVLGCIIGSFAMFGYMKDDCIPKQIKEETENATNDGDKLSSQ